MNIMCPQFNINKIEPILNNLITDFTFFINYLFS